MAHELGVPQETSIQAGVNRLTQFHRPEFGKISVQNQGQMVTIFGFVDHKRSLQQRLNSPL